MKIFLNSTWLYFNSLSGQKCSSLYKWQRHDQSRGAQCTIATPMMIILALPCLPCLPCLPGCLPVWLPGAPPPRWQEGASLHLLHCNQSNHSRLAGLSSTPISQHASAGHNFSASSLSALVISPISRHAWFSQISPSEQ